MPWTNPADLACVALLGLELVEHGVLPLERQSARLATAAERVSAPCSGAALVPVPHGDRSNPLGYSQRTVSGVNRVEDGDGYCGDELLIVRIEGEHHSLSIGAGPFRLEGSGFVGLATHVICRVPPSRLTRHRNPLQHRAFLALSGDVSGSGFGRTTLVLSGLTPAFSFCVGCRVRWEGEKNEGVKDGALKEKGTEGAQSGGSGPLGAA